MELPDKTVAEAKAAKLIGPVLAVMFRYEGPQCIQMVQFADDPVVLIHDQDGPVPVFRVIKLFLCLFKGKHGLK